MLWRAPAADPAAGRPLLTGAGTVGLSAFVLFSALAFTGAAEPPAIGDPGAFVRWALPAATLAHHVGMSITVASGLFLAGILPARSPLFRRAAVIGAIAAAVWALSAAMVLLLGFADIVGQPLSLDSGFLQQLVHYVSSVTSGQARLAVLLAAVVVAGLLIALPTRRGGAGAVVLGTAAVLPLSLIGHASSSDLRFAAVSSLALHVVGVTAWVGGVMVLGLLAGIHNTARSPALVPIAVFSRFSTLAGIAFAVVFASGVVNSFIRLGDFGNLFTPYGSLIMLKMAATLALGVIGYLHRKWLSKRQGSITERRMVWRLVAVEILIMAGTMAVAVALATSDPGMGSMPGMDMGAGGLHH